jgi:hypothetical protein
MAAPASETGHMSPRTARTPASAAAAGSRLALTRSEAAAALGMSLDSFERHVQSELRIVRRGKLRLVPLREIERWLDENATRLMDV